MCRPCFIGTRVKGANASAERGVLACFSYTETIPMAFRRCKKVIVAIIAFKNMLRFQVSLNEFNSRSFSLTECQFTPSSCQVLWPDFVPFPVAGAASCSMPKPFPDPVVLQVGQEVAACPGCQPALQPALSAAGDPAKRGQQKNCLVHSCNPEHCAVPGHAF